MDISYYKKMEPFFDSWKIRRLLGEGSFGKVFEIERTEFGHTYLAAMKAITIPQSQSEIRSVMSDGMDAKSVTDYYQDFVGEVIREFELMSKLKGNSNIVSYEDHRVIEHQNDIGWDILIRMELLTPLLDHMKDHIMSEREILSLGIDICKALECCQKYHIIHRDIKPENIFLSANGDFKLGDFGIARTMEKTVDDMSKKGTYTYMAPEVYKGETYGSNVDTYSLGIVLYRLLNHNRAPFLPMYPDPITYGDRQKATMKRISGEALPRPSSGNDRLVEIVLRACAYQPEERYESPEKMRRDLEILAYGNSRVLVDDDTELLSDDNTELLSDENIKLPVDDSTQMLTDGKTGILSQEETGGDETEIDDSDTLEKPAETKLSCWKMLFASRGRVCTITAVVFCLALSIIFTTAIAGKKTEVRQKDNSAPSTVSKEKKVEKKKENEEDAAVLEVPLFVGMSKKEVKEKLQELKKDSGYTFTVANYNKEYSVSIPKGKVVAQSLQPGKKVKTSEKLVLSISLGPKKIVMPKLLNMREKDAMDTLSKLNLQAKVSYQYSNSVESGCVISQSIGEKEEIYEGTTIDLTVSRGAAPTSGTADSQYTADQSYDDTEYYEPQTTSAPSNEPDDPISVPDDELGGDDSNSDSDFGGGDSNFDSDPGGGDYDSGSDSDSDGSLADSDTGADSASDSDL